jgi:hypothetical protein
MKKVDKVVQNPRQTSTAQQCQQFYITGQCSTVGKSNRQTNGWTDGGTGGSLDI